MAKPYSRIRGKICDLRRCGDDSFVRVEVLDLVKELGEWFYRIRYVDGGIISMLSKDDIVEIIELKDMKPKLKLVGGPIGVRRAKEG